MLRKNQDGLLQALALPFLIVVLMLIIMTGLSIWSYSQYTDQKDNVDAKISDAVEVADSKLRTKLEAEFDEKEKSPYSTYQGSATLGSITIKYPKTWSVYVEERESGRIGIDAFFHPRFVPDTKSDTAYALRMELLDNQYSSELEKYLKQVERKDAKSKPVKISGVEGVRINGEYEKDKEGSIVLLPLRDKTLKVYTESPDFVKDFNNIIIKNLKFIP